MVTYQSVLVHRQNGMLTTHQGMLRTSTNTTVTIRKATETVYYYNTDYVCFGHFKSDMFTVQRRIPVGLSNVNLPVRLQL